MNHNLDESSGSGQCIAMVNSDDDVDGDGDDDGQEEEEKDYEDILIKDDKVNRCLARYSPRATTTNRPTNRALNKPARPGPN